MEELVNRAKNIYLVANATLFNFFISQLGIETSTVHFLYTRYITGNFDWDFGGVDVRWFGGLLVLELY